MGTRQALERKAKTKASSIPRLHLSQLKPLHIKSASLLAVETKPAYYCCRYHHLAEHIF